jgi:hypothetical protein
MRSRFNARRCGHTPRLLLGALALLLASLPVSAQQPAVLRLGQPATGTLRDSDPKMISGLGPFHTYRLEATAGDRLVLTLRSGAFDAYLGILHPVGGIHELMATDDDSGGGSDARLRWTVPATGSYIVVAQSLEPNGRGGYTLSVDRAPQTRPIAALPISIGESRQGTLTEESSLVEGEETFHDLYAFDARAGQVLLLTLVSSDFDAYLALGTLNGTAMDLIASDDDGGDETNARLRVTIPQDGRYGVQARGFGADALGNYTLTIREVTIPAPKPLARGRDSNAALGDEGVDQWLIQGNAGERVRVRMKSGDFDAYLLLGRLVDGGFELLHENDDESDGSTDALIEFTLPASGQYVVRATSFGGAGSGSYSIRFDAVP